MRIGKQRDKAYTGCMIRSERGSIFFYLLLGIALFAAVNFTVSRMGKSSGTQTFSDERARMLASEIISQGSVLAEAAAKMKLRGVPAEQYLFNSNFDAYTNAACTTDKCKLFHLSGGGLDYMLPPEGVNSGEKWGFTGDTRVDVGSVPYINNDDLMAVLPNVSQKICTEINRLVGNPWPDGSLGDPIPNIAATRTLNKFTGTFGSSAPVIRTRSGCIQIQTTAGTAVGAHASKYHYFILLYSR